MLLILSGCHADSIEKAAKLKVAVDTVEYGEALSDLWNETYPENQDVISYEVMDDEAKLEADIFMLSDAETAYLYDGLYELPKQFEKKFEVEARNDFSEVINTVKNVYYPISAEGMLYALNLTKIVDEGYHVSDFERFETMAGKENAMFYMQHLLYTLPLLSSDTAYLPGIKNPITDFKNTAFESALNDFKMVIKLLDLKSDPASFDNWFIYQNYMSGLIGPWMQADFSEEENNMTLYYRSLPTINGKQLKTVAQSSGYVINENTKYPHAAMKVIELMHSVKGMQLLLDETDQIALIGKEETAQFTFNKKHQLEKVVAMNDSIQDNLVGLRNADSVGAWDILKDEQLLNLLHNECFNESVEVCIQQLTQRNYEWIQSFNEK